MRIAIVAAVACSTPTPAPEPAVPDAYASHVAKLRASLREHGLGDAAIRVEPPFVVIGDAGASALAHDATTVRWASDLLEADFFRTRPTRILDIYLFHGKDSYDAGVLELTGEPPDTPYGFYSSSHHGLFMNISTGGGTLVHEIVHPYVEADFPDAPPWLNEGLGSLFEQCDEHDAHIVGLPNWRLPGLQRAIALGHVPAIRALTALDARAFYADRTGVDYAMSRYLLYDLQQQGKLRGFYRAFHDARARDPTGYDTLVATVGDIDAFDRDWKKFVGGLEFR